MMEKLNEVIDTETFKEQIKKRLKQRFKESIKYIAVIIITFYALPLAIKDIGMGILIALLITPILFFIMTMIYGLYHKGIIFLITTLVIIYIPSAFIFYNSLALLFCLWYICTCLMGWYMGRCAKALSHIIVEQIAK